MKTKFGRGGRRRRQQRAQKKARVAMKTARFFRAAYRHGMTMYLRGMKGVV